MSTEEAALSTELNTMMGKRVRYHDEGEGESRRYRTDSGHEGESILAPFSITIEGEATGWILDMSNGIASLDIAGYGYVPAELCEVIDDAEEAP